MIRQQVKVYGNVQGVGFRFFTLRQAKAFHIKGWVRNNADGTVEIDAQGDKQQMKDFLDMIRIGSPRSHVTEVKVKNVPKLAKYKTFQIRY